MDPNHSQAAGEGGTPHGVARAGLVLGVLGALGVGFFADLDPQNPVTTRTAAVAVLMAIWWITEAVPLAVTALLPIFLFPALGIMSGGAVCGRYADDTIFLFVGGFLVALAMERWHLHRRIAGGVLRAFGTRPAGVLGGFIASTALVSMFISNTATAMMMVPIAMAVIVRLDEEAGGRSRLGEGLLLGVAYAASIGGMATLVGTPPNLVYRGVLKSTFPDAPEVTFGQWLIFGVPLAVTFLLLLWGYLVLQFGRGAVMSPSASSAGLGRMGPMSREEKAVLAVCVVLGFLWMFRADLELGFATVPGWSNLFQQGSFWKDGNVAMLMATVLFLIPSRREGTKRILDGDAFRRLPWDIVLLFGGGFALAAGFQESGLSQWVGARLAGLGGLHPILLVAGVCASITFLTELTSNTASANLLLPILGAMSVQIGMDPRILMVAGTISCSCAFMLPVATPPNAIVFGTGRVTVVGMARAGLMLNLAGVVIATLLTLAVARISFGFEMEGLPAWANGAGP